ncbi:MAG: Transcriptional regulator, TrmB [Candidatus Magasanikbacteria bacterium GW2011_GWA2_56_11]|uniref:Transcriptional regulator, TrmB n=1 Tax=Candidatus Magasanikbacteria bacterium GW2011_GWA2_56_11 TaxID=1619044 RepID=A0A0G2B9I1_9BACT|nr:MAG: Transcriptional regulator, TrmB [Candidatus Magasanikbacteria bacterium GW2011_GWA2_56_11]
MYLAALQLGPASVQAIAEQAGLHRVSAYDILPSLITKGLLRQTARGKKRFFEAADPDEIYQSLHEKQIAYINLLPELRAIQSKGAQKPKVFYYEGKEMIWQAYYDRIRHDIPDKENLVYGTSAELLTLFPKGYEEFTKERIRRGIGARIIVEKSSSGLLEAKRAKDELREVRFLPAGQSFKSHTIIYGNRVMTVSWQSCILVIIEDQANADNQRLVWRMLWKGLKIPLVNK